MLELLKNPEIKEQTLDVVKSQQFRSHLEDTIQETIETPQFQAKMKDILLKAAEKKEDKEKEGGGNQEEEGKKEDRKSTRLNSSHVAISYAVFCLKKKKRQKQ